MVSACEVRKSTQDVPKSMIVHRRYIMVDSGCEEGQGRFVSASEFFICVLVSANRSIGAFSNEPLFPSLLSV